MLIPQEVVSPPSATATQSQEPAVGSAGTSRSVLVVDDNVDAAESLAALLRACGHQVSVAHDGPAALASVQQVVPDVALLDIGMPAMDGYELAGHLRFQVGCEYLPIIAVTGLGGEQAEGQSRAKGFVAHLVKPVDPRALAALLV